MLDNIKHITDDNFFSFSKIAHMCIVCNTIQLSEICDFRVTPVLPGSVEAQWWRANLSDVTVNSGYCQVQYFMPEIHQKSFTVRIIRILFLTVKYVYDRWKTSTQHGAPYSLVSCLSAEELVKLTESIEMPFGLSTRVSRRKHVFVEGQVGATLRIRLNRPCAAMRPYDKFYFDHLFFLQYIEDFRTV